MIQDAASLLALVVFAAPFLLWCSHTYTYRHQTFAGEHEAWLAPPSRPQRGHSSLPRCESRCTSCRERVLFIERHRRRHLRISCRGSARRCGAARTRDQPASGANRGARPERKSFCVGICRLCCRSASRPRTLLLESRCLQAHGVAQARNCVGVVNYAGVEILTFFSALMVVR